MKKHYVLGAYSHWPASDDKAPGAVERGGAFTSLAGAKRAAVRLRDAFGMESCFVERDDGNIVERWSRCQGSTKWHRTIWVPSYD